MARPTRGLIAVFAVLALGACGSPGSVTSDAASDVEYESVRLTYSTDQAERLRIADPPDVQLVRWITLDEWPAQMVACMNDAGYPGVKVIDGGGVEYAGISEDQAAAAALAQYTCEAQYTVHPIYETSLSAESLGVLYDYQTGELTDCLVANGFVVPAPPARDVFMASYYASDGASWSPYENVGTDDNPLTSEEWTAINAECPQQPPLDELYGSMPTAGTS